MSFAIYVRQELLVATASDDIHSVTQQAPEAIQADRISLEVVCRKFVSGLQVDVSSEAWN